MSGREKEIFRGYDSSELFREDTLERIKRLGIEIKEGRKRIEEIEKNLPPATPSLPEEKDDECE